MATDEGLDARGPATDADAVTATFVTTPISAIKSYYVSDRNGVWRSLASVAGFTCLAVLEPHHRVFYLAMDFIWAVTALPPLVRRRTVSIVITPNGVRQEIAGRPRFLLWARLTSLRHAGGYWVLRKDDLKIAIPISALDSEQTERFLAIARSHGLGESAASSSPRSRELSR